MEVRTVSDLLMDVLEHIHGNHPHVDLQNPIRIQAKNYELYHQRYLELPTGADPDERELKKHQQ